MWETLPNGKPLYGKVSPEGHADMVYQLVQTTEQGRNEVPFITQPNGKAARAPEDLEFVDDWSQ